jgi:hypothetical protein
MLTGLDKLGELLKRVQKAESLASQAALKKRLLKKRADRGTVSEDYTRRLQDRSIFRRLLADDALDAARFRWYFTHIENTQPLDDIRRWIDGKLEKERCAHGSASPSSPAGTAG